MDQVILILAELCVQRLDSVIQTNILFYSCILKNWKSIFCMKFEVVS